ncbi:Lipase [Diplonema papillatum]|nr:Lipase [Diplonema papillatum]
MLSTLILSALAAAAVGGELPRQVLPVSLEDQARYQLYLAYGAYCKRSSIEAWDCKWCKTAGPAKKVYGVVQKDEYDGQAYVMINNASMIVISFRGSSNIENWIEDFTFEKIPLKWTGVPMGVSVHEGFYNSYTSMRPEILQWLQQATTDCPHCTIHVTGHSLGAAEAQLCATDLRLQGFDPRMWTYGQPRVGNKAYAEFFDKMTNTSNPVFRMVNQKDVVPHLPIVDQFYHHNAREVWRMENNTYVMCDNTGEDKECSRSLFLLECNAADHLEYMGIHESC